MMKIKLSNINTIFSKLILISFLFLLFHLDAICQDVRTEVAGIPVNYDESKVGTYTLPDPLILQNGDNVKNEKDWFQKRRPEILSLFESEQFGKCPSREHTSFKVFDKGAPVFDNKAIRKQIILYFTEDTSKYKADVALYIPANAKKPVPVFLMINMTPNSLRIKDSGLNPGLIWTREGKQISAAKGRSFRYFDVEKYIAEGIGVASIYYGDIEPDFADGIKYGIRGYFLKDGQTWPAPDEWGVISAWAWGLGYVMDYLETDKQVDEKKWLFTVFRGWGKPFCGPVPAMHGLGWSLRIVRAKVALHFPGVILEKPLNT